MGIGWISDIRKSEKLRVIRQRIEYTMFIIKMSTALAYFIVLLSFIISYLNVRTLQLMSWINTVFICSLVVLVVGLILIVLQGGFLDRFISNFRHFLKKRGKADEIAREIEGQSLGEASSEIKREEKRIHSSSIVMSVSGGVLVLISIILSYYLS